MTIQTPDYYAKVLKELNIRYYIILSEFATTYPKYKTNPTITQYSDAIETDEENLQELQSEFFQLKNNLENNISELGRDVFRTNRKISILDKENKILSSKITNMDNSSAAALGMFNDIQLQYNQYLFGNVLLGLIIIGASYNFYRNKK